MKFSSHFYEANGITFNVSEGGDNGLPAILFLHGFPGFYHSWQKQTEYFALHGYHVIVPDQRGYNKTEKPRNIHDYRLAILVEDMVQLLSAMQVKETAVVAHDWGGIIAWALIKKHPQLFTKAIIINAPYPPSFAKFSFSQMFKSWYVYFFQLPKIPEWLMTRNNFARLVTMLRESSLPGTFSDEDILLYKEAWQNEDSLHFMIHWYRAMVKYREDAKAIFGVRKPIEVPVLVLWGLQDKFLNRETGVCPQKHCPNISIKEYADATHWLPQEKSDEVNGEILRFITG